jgi:MraZ protein
MRARHVGPPVTWSRTFKNGLGCMLRGNTLAKVDDKGRLKLPAAFRSIIEPKYGKEFFVTSFRGESARIYPLKVYTRLEQRLLDSSAVQPLVNKLKNSLNFYGQSALMDSQGRVLIHPLLRKRVELSGEVAVLGQQNYLEVWNLTSFEEWLKHDPLTDQDLKELAVFGF